MRSERGYNIGKKMQRIPQVKMKERPGKVVSVSKWGTNLPRCLELFGFYQQKSCAAGNLSPEQTRTVGLPINYSYRAGCRRKDSSRTNLQKK